ncbi:MAG: GNAT family N-acetyltransferase [Verrucomicrobiales bacterium VVV1]|nr:MAG: GNAT family N-acetyltransferase [Verrucomicrobiales bacterium VVV1]
MTSRDPHDLQPVLACPALTLRPLTVADWAPLFAVAGDPLIWAGHPAHDRWQEPVFRSFFDASLASGGGLVAIDNASGAIIGHSRYDRERVAPGEVEIGWTFLARAHWGGGTNALMKALMIGHALTQCDRAVFLVGESNIRSRRAMEKIGGVLTDREQVTMLAGQPIRHVLYAIDAAAFAAGPLAALVPEQAG